MLASLSSDNDVDLFGFSSLIQEQAIDISGPLKLQSVSVTKLRRRFLQLSTVPSGDPTFIALSLLWYAMYAWDEVLELLLKEVGWLRLSKECHYSRPPVRQPTLSAVPESPAGTAASVAQASLEASAELASGTPLRRSPWILKEQYNDRFFDEEMVEMDLELEDEVEASEPQERLLKKESRILLNEIERLEMTSRMLDKRLGNVMQLAFSSVNIEDSKRMSRLAEAAGI
ncbi:hypothetical protein MPER_04714 [Moniliophthora perniciosa FA553]|nr:hypothetical protein MPER_04714 [Moniliophthora perniciosa FA553]